jgi:hypothetical protein
MSGDYRWVALIHAAIILVIAWVWAWGRSTDGSIALLLIPLSFVLWAGGIAFSGLSWIRGWGVANAGVRGSFLFVSLLSPILALPLIPVLERPAAAAERGLMALDERVSERAKEAHCRSFREDLVGIVRVREEISGYLILESGHAIDLVGVRISRAQQTEWQRYVREQLTGRNVELGIRADCESWYSFGAISGAIERVVPRDSRGRWYTAIQGFIWLDGELVNTRFTSPSAQEWLEEQAAAATR